MRSTAMLFEIDLIQSTATVRCQGGGQQQPGVPGHAMCWGVFRRRLPLRFWGAERRMRVRTKGDAKTLMHPPMMLQLRMGFWTVLFLRGADVGDRNAIQKNKAIPRLEFQA